MRVLLALDGTAAGEPAARAIGNWARETGTEVVLFHVLRPSDIHSQPEREYMAVGVAPQGTPSGQALPESRPILPRQAETRPQAAARLHDERESYLRMVARQELPGVTTTFVVHEGDDVARCLVAGAKEVQADFIAMASRGRGQLREALFGAVHDDVVRNATVPVLVVGPNAHG
jgi:nucleotide-binding universal stress UspA family protein